MKTQHFPQQLMAELTGRSLKDIGTLAGWLTLLGVALLLLRFGQD